MAASVTLTPAAPRVGQAVVIDADDFLPATKLTVTIVEPSGSTLDVDILSDSGGTISTTDEADPAVQTLTLAGNAVAAETVVVGAVTYTWRAAPTTVANEVKVGATASESLDNLKAAINLAAGSGSLYGSLTVVHPTVRAHTKTATTLLLVAKTGGTGGNALASTETMTQGSFGAATFAGGAAATGRNAIRFTPSRVGYHTFTVTDGTTTVTATAQVYTTS